MRIPQIRRGLHERRDVDSSTGRTSPEQLRQRGIGETVWPMVQDAIDQGAEHEELVAAFQAATDESGELLADKLKRRRAQMLREHRAIRRGMQRRMRALWGRAFDAFYEVYVCAEEIGSDLQQVHGGAADPLMDALLGLHARACLLLAELHTLMVGGFPLGAWARTRSPQRNRSCRDVAQRLRPDGWH